MTVASDKEKLLTNEMITSSLDTALHLHMPKEVVFPIYVILVFILIVCTIALIMCIRNI